jgi:hypothetical protein
MKSPRLCIGPARELADRERPPGEVIGDLELRRDVDELRTDAAEEERVKAGGWSGAVRAHARIMTAAAVARPAGRLRSGRPLSRSD